MTLNPTFQNITATIAVFATAWVALLGTEILDGKKSESSSRYVFAHAVAHPILALAAVGILYVTVAFIIQKREEMQADVERVSSLSTAFRFFEVHKLVKAREQAGALRRDYQNDHQYLLQFWQSFENILSEFPLKYQQESQAHRGFGVGQRTQFVFVSWPGQVHKAVVILHDATKPNYEFTELALQGVPTAELLKSVSHTLSYSDLENLAHRLRNTVGPLINMGIGGATYFGAQDSASNDAAKWCCFILPYDLQDFDYVKLIKSSFGFES